MKIAIDISQLAYPNTGVANYLENILLKLLENKEHEYILFFSSLRGNPQDKIYQVIKDSKNVEIKSFKMPLSFLDLMWNKLHIFPIENFIGKVDVFITSDWVEPPAKNALKATILYDLVVYKYPKETAAKIIEVQKRKLKWVKKESSFVFCISDSTKNDAQKLLGIDPSKLRVIYPGLTI